MVYGYLQFVEDDKYCNAIYWRPVNCNIVIHFYVSVQFNEYIAKGPGIDSGFMAKVRATLASIVAKLSS